MNPDQVFQWVMNYGLGVVLSVFTAFALWRILIYVLNENSRREERLAGIIENHLAELGKSINRTNEMLYKRDGYFDDFKEVSRMQRQEHEEMIKRLHEIGRILSDIEKKLERIQDKA